MYFLALAVDYDGTIANQGAVDPLTIQALEKLKATGRRLVLVTGRNLVSLRKAFSQFELFDRIVAENGALLFDPKTRSERTIAPAASVALVEALRRRNVAPLTVGQSIIATWVPNERIVLEAIQELGLELQIIFNKGAVMILPTDVNKASGLKAALQELDISPLNVVGVGDAENDHAFLHSCGCAAAVANALATIKDEVDMCLSGDHGAGVVELIERLCREDARILPPHRHGVLVGHDRDGKEVYVEPQRGSVLIAGKSGTGKSTLATALTEHMAEKKFQFCIFDPEGDYGDLEHAVSNGNAKAPPVVEEILELLHKLEANVVVNTQALALADRPAFFAKLLPRVLSLRARTGRPQWILVDEAHHLVSAARDDVGESLPEAIPAAVFITVHPETMGVSALRTVEYVLAMGDGATEALQGFCEAVEIEAPMRIPDLDEDEVLFWARSTDKAPYPVKAVKAKQARDRHKRKYAEGELDKDHSFYFRGPDNQLNLRAQNLMLFVQLAEGVDSRTWEHHRRSKEYSAWFRKVIKDDELAREAEIVENDPNIDADESRARIIEAVTRRYTASAQGPRNWHERDAKPSV
jgi:HAD superfamily hydrolase (TIGR01484 family)